MMKLPDVICIALSLIEINCAKHSANPPLTGEVSNLASAPEVRVVPVSGGDLQGSNAASIRLSVRLIDGSQLIGTPSSIVLLLRSPYGLIDIQLDQVASMIAPSPKMKSGCLPWIDKLKF